MQQVSPDYFEILSASVKLLKTEPLMVSAEKLQGMQSQLQEYKKARGKRDWWLSFFISLLICTAFLGEVLSFGFAGAAVLWMMEGTASGWLIPAGLAALGVFIWAHIKSCAWMDTSSTARWKADELDQLLKPWNRQDWERAKIVSSLCAEAETYFAQITAEKTPMKFQLTALHRLANVLTPLDEWALDEGECEAPRTALYLHQHPNWPGKSVS